MTALREGGEAKNFLALVSLYSFPEMFKFTNQIIFKLTKYKLPLAKHYVIEIES